MPEVQLNSRLQVDTRYAIGNYALGETLGKGVFSVVKASTHLITGQKVAVKVVDRTKVKEKDLKTLVREMQVMKLLTNPNIAKLYEIIDTSEAFYLVLEMVAGDTLHAYLKTEGTVSETLAADWMRQLASGVQYCHSRHVVHRDIKLNNIMVDPSGRIKLIDFGLSREFEARKIETHCGTPVYAAPELFRSGGYFGPAVDMWAIGVVLHACVGGKLPFKGNNFRKRIQEGEYENPKWFSTKLKAVLATLLDVNPKRRSTATEFLKSPWITQTENTTTPVEALPFEDAIDMDCVKAMRKLGFEEQEVLASVQNDLYDHTAATYYLLKAHKGKDFDLEPLLVQLPPNAISASRRQSNSPGLIIVPPAGSSSPAHPGRYSPHDYDYRKGSPLPGRKEKESSTSPFPRRASSTEPMKVAPRRSSLFDYLSLSPKARRVSSPNSDNVLTSSGQPSKVTSKLSTACPQPEYFPTDSPTLSPKGRRRGSLADTLMSPLTSLKNMKLGSSREDILANGHTVKDEKPSHTRQHSISHVPVAQATTTAAENFLYPTSPKPSFRRNY
eukprot:CFRG1902T1